MDLWGWVYYEQDARTRTNARYQEVQLDRLAAMADDRHPNRGIGRRRGMSTLGALLRGDNEMNTNHTSILDGRLFRIGLFAALAVVVLVGAAYLWGTGLRAAAPQAIAPASSFNELAGVAGDQGPGFRRGLPAGGSRPPPSGSALHRLRRRRGSSSGGRERRGTAASCGDRCRTGGRCLDLRQEQPSGDGGGACGGPGRECARLTGCRGGNAGIEQPGIAASQVANISKKHVVVARRDLSMSADMAQVLCLPGQRLHCHGRKTELRENLNTIL